MAAPFVPKPPRGRIPISEADRAAARSGMDGEKTKQPSEGAAASAPTQPVAPLVAESASPAAAQIKPAPSVTAELVAPVAEPAPVGSPMPAASIPVSAVAASEAIESIPESVPVVAPTVLGKPASQLTATAASGRRGRKPTVDTTTAQPAPVRSVKIRETVWGDIKLLLALLPKEENTPRNIQAYVEAAHQHYEAHLRKQGKLPLK
jgi:hypothetical protein